MNVTKKLMAGLAAVALATACTGMRAQLATTAEGPTGAEPALAATMALASSSLATPSTAALPEAPSALIADPLQQPLQATLPPQNPPAGHAPPVAPLRWKYIPAGYSYQHLTQKDKVYIGFRDLYSAGNFAAMFLSAGLEQIENGAPNYGTDKGAFGERLGAAGIRETSEGIFTDVVFSPLFHEDPRFFAEGPAHPFTQRLFHAVTRIFYTRTDAGGHSVNYALLTGYAASTALQVAYFPPINRNARDMAASYGSSLGGAALGFGVDEFVDGILQKLHLEKQP
jgi:hypothetical protein